MLPSRHSVKPMSIHLRLTNILNHGSMHLITTHDPEPGRLGVLVPDKTSHLAVGLR